MQEKNKAKPIRPRSIILIIFITLFMTMRASLAIYLPQIGSSPDSAPISWILPLLLDTIIGATAPFLALLLWRWKGLGVWTAGVVWTVLGTWDLGTGVILEFVDPWMNTPLGSSYRFIPIIILSLVNLYLLFRSDVRQYYLYARETLSEESFES